MNGTIILAVLCSTAGATENPRESAQATALVPIEDPVGLVLGANEILYVVDRGTHRVLGIDPRRGLFAVAGNGEVGYCGDGGSATSASLHAPTEITMDTLGNLFIADTGNHVIRKVDSKGVITTLAGTGEAGFSGDGGPPLKATLSHPMGIDLDDHGNLYIADHGNHRIRRIDLGLDQITTIAGTGKDGLPRDGYRAIDEPLLGPRSLVINGGFAWVALCEGNTLWRLRPGGTIRRIVGTGRSGAHVDSQNALDTQLASPEGLVIGPDRRVYISDTGNGRVLRLDAVSGRIEVAASDLASPRGIAAAGPIGPMAVVEGEAAKIAKIGEPLDAGIHVARATMFRNRDHLDLTRPNRLRDYDSFSPPPDLPLGIVWPAGSWQEWYRQPTFPQQIVYPGFQSWNQSRLSAPWQLPPGYPTISSGQPFPYQPYYRFQFKPSIGSYAHPGRN